MLLNLLGKKLLLGIDIGTTSIKIVELRKANSKVELTNYGILEKFGHLERINDAIQTSSFKLLEESTALLLKKTMEDVKPKTGEAYLSLPSFSGFISTLELPEMTERELVKAIKFQAGQYIPMPLNDVTLDWQIIERINGKMTIVLMAVPTEAIKRYINIAQALKIELKGLELENVAVCRLFGKKETGPAVLVDIGGRSTCLSVMDQGALRMSYNIDTAGGDLTQVIASGLGINPFRAEELKRSYGLKIQSQGDVKIINLLTPLLDVIKREIEKISGNYYLRTKRKVEKIIFTGGGANLGGLEEYYYQQLGLPILKGDPFAWGLISYNPNLAPIIKEVGTSLSSACAVVLKNI
ncbi:MAG: pilus assembly protein PilM [Candidatus Paceibacterota bacterium]